MLFNKKMTLLCSSPGACNVPCIIGVNLNALPQLAELGHGLPGEGGGPPVPDLPGLEHLGGKEQARRSSSSPSLAAEPQKALTSPSHGSMLRKTLRVMSGLGPTGKEVRESRVDAFWGP